jgi:hypothetical protein
MISQVSEYIIPLLTHARSLANGALFLRATAACFREAWRIVDTLLEIPGQGHPPSTEKGVSKAQAEDVVCVSPTTPLSFSFGITLFLLHFFLRLSLSI